MRNSSPSFWILGVDWVTLDVFEGTAEFFRVVVLFSQVLETCKHPFQLIKAVLGFGLRAHIPVVHFKHCFPERRDHKQILDDTVHVTNAPNVFKAHVASTRLLKLVLRSDLPVGLSWRAPEPANVVAENVISQVLNEHLVSSLVVHAEFADQAQALL